MKTGKPKKLYIVSFEHCKDSKVFRGMDAVLDFCKVSERTIRAAYTNGKPFQTANGATFIDEYLDISEWG